MGRRPVGRLPQLGPDPPARQSVLPAMKAVTYAVLLLAMVGVAFGVYRIAGMLKSDGSHVQKPTSTYAQALPGKMFVAQGGAIYRFQNGTFTQITDDAGWTQPSSSPDGKQLVAVQRHLNYSEDRKSTRLNSSHLVISYAVFCLKNKKNHAPD